MKAILAPRHQNLIAHGSHNKAFITKIGKIYARGITICNPDKQFVFGSILIIFDNRQMITRSGIQICL